MAPSSEHCLDDDDEAASIFGFVIEPSLQGHGIGRAALRQACEQLRADGARRISLDVDVANDRALGLYTSIGFTPVTTEDYFALPLAESDRLVGEAAHFTTWPDATQTPKSPVTLATDGFGGERLLDCLSQLIGPRKLGRGDDRVPVCWLADANDRRGHAGPVGAPSASAAGATPCCSATASKRRIFRRVCGSSMASSVGR